MRERIGHLFGEGPLWPLRQTFRELLSLLTFLKKTSVELPTVFSGDMSRALRVRLGCPTKFVPCCR